MFWPLSLLFAPDPWVWPGVWWIVHDDVVAGILVYQDVRDMFWFSHRILPVDHRVTTRRFWDDTFDRGPSIVNAWTGESESTFPAGWVAGAPEPVLEVSMRSLCPRSGPGRHDVPILLEWRERFASGIAHHLGARELDVLRSHCG